MNRVQDEVALVLEAREMPAAGQSEEAIFDRTGSEDRRRQVSARGQCALLWACPDPDA
nr:hypothetical protein KitaXyl93_78860 [Kitasatospora sp. Xyl93]